MLESDIKENTLFQKNQQQRLLATCEPHVEAEDSDRGRAGTGRGGAVNTEGGMEGGVEVKVKVVVALAGRGQMRKVLAESELQRKADGELTSSALMRFEVLSSAP